MNKIDTKNIVLTDEALRFFFGGTIGKPTRKRKPLGFIPKTISLSQFGKSGAGQEFEDPIELGKDDPALEDAFKESHFLFILKSLPKDKYRVIALLLFLKNEMGYNYTNQDFADIWGTEEYNIVKMIKRIRTTLDKKGVSAKKSVNKDKAV